MDGVWSRTAVASGEDEIRELVGGAWVRWGQWDTVESAPVVQEGLEHVLVDQAFGRKAHRAERSLKAARLIAPFARGQCHTVGGLVAWG